MKSIIEIFQRGSKLYSNRVIALMLFTTANITIAGAQERGRQHGADNRQGAGQVRVYTPQANRPAMNNRSQINSTPQAGRQPQYQQQGQVNRQSTGNTNRWQGARTTANGVNQARGFESRTVPNAERSNAARFNNTRTTAPSAYRGNYPRPVYSANNPSWHYANFPRRNSVITTIPVGYRTINYGGYDYRYNRGVFYRPYNNTFMVVAPPVGIYINTLPMGYRRILVRDYPYYYYNGTYYDYRDNNYLVVSPPVGAIVESLPPGFETVTIDGETYYTVDGAQYKAVVQENGEIWYEVIKAN